MNNLEIHTLICKRDTRLWVDTLRLFKHYSELEYTIHVHEDGSFDDTDCIYLEQNLPGVVIHRRDEANKRIVGLLENYPLCTHFRLAEHHTIFRIKLFDPFLFSDSKNVICMDADILFCKRPDELIYCIKNSIGAYLRDTWSSYCVPFRDEDGDKSIIRFINAGLSYIPTDAHYSLDAIEKCLEILYEHGSRGATHPFLEQNCLAYMITQQTIKGHRFLQLKHPDYCVPTFGKFVPDHGCTTLHLNSSPAVGLYKNDHYQYELAKICDPSV